MRIEKKKAKNALKFFFHLLSIHHENDYLVQHHIDFLFVYLVSNVSVILFS